MKEWVAWLELLHQDCEQGEVYAAAYLADDLELVHTLLLSVAVIH